METNVPNLDAMGPDDLMKFSARHQNGYNARDLFPELGRGTQRATWDLANYAGNKATAMRCRLYGDIQAATMYEGIADRIYEELPPFARW